MTTEWSQDNILVLAASTGKKGGGTHAILSLLQELISFQDKVTASIEAQDLGENKQKLEEFQTRLGEMYTSLLEMAKGGVRSVRQEASHPEENPIMLNDNTIQQIP
ncbi:MAG: hypothetical protein WC119_01850 [Synergistaceae bacterium]